MSEVFNNIISRRSVRKFKTDKISKEELERVVLAGMYAPSAKNTQNWQITVVENPEKLDQLNEGLSQVLDMKYHHFYNAPVLILVSTPKDYEHGAFDTTAVIQNMCLEAFDEGIGSVWINQLNGNSDHPKLRKILSDIKIPEDHRVWGSVALGYPATQVPGERENKGTVVFVS